MEDETIPTERCVSPPSPDPPPSTHFPQPPSPCTSIDEIQVQVRELVSAETLDKAMALSITRLFHEMESLYIRENMLHERQLSEIRNDLERTRMQAELDRLARRHTLHEAELPSSTPKRRRW